VATGVPLLAWHRHGHAPHGGPGTAARASADAFMGHIERVVVHRRYRQAVQAAGEAWRFAPLDASFHIT